jgi:hypothetical protein
MMWLVAGLSLGMIVVALVAWRWRRQRRQDLGIMSDQWMAEQRLTQGPDPNR